MLAFKLIAVTVLLTAGVYGAVHCAIDIETISEKFTISAFIVVLTLQMAVLVWQIA